MIRRAGKYYFRYILPKYAARCGMANFGWCIRERIRELSRQKYYSQMDVVYNLARALINIFSPHDGLSSRFRRYRRFSYKKNVY